MNNPLNPSHNTSPPIESNAINSTVIFDRYNYTVYPAVDDANTGFQLGYGLLLSPASDSTVQIPEHTEINVNQSVPSPDNAVNTSFNERRAAQLAAEAEAAYQTETASVVSQQLNSPEGVVDLHAEERRAEARRATESALDYVEEQPRAA